MSYLQTQFLSHAQKVMRLYKKAARLTQSYYSERNRFRYHAVLLRARFDENRNADPNEAVRLLHAGEKELWDKQHPQPLKFPNSPGGVAFGREAYTPDSMLDAWHPLEKAQYPEYFARRDQRKKEYIERWEKKYGKVEPASH